jgi:hypothetical protein
MSSVPRTSVAVDLFGDLDLTLVALVVETLGDIARHGPADVVLSTRGLALTSNTALRALNLELEDARKSGTVVEILPGNRKHRRRVAADVPVTRHFMLARHAAQGELDRSA